jgi:methionyl-tRNA formyltransferase
MPGLNAMTKAAAPRLVFMGTPDFAVPSLRMLADDYDIVAAYCQPPRPKGRGMRLSPQPVHLVAEDLNILVKTPTHFDDVAVDELTALAPDLLVVVAYGLILPQRVLSLPRLGAVNGHASLLPRWRGAAPIHRAIAAGDKETGVSVMMMEKGLDTGPVILEKRLAIAHDDTMGHLHDVLADLTAAALSEAIPLIIQGCAEPKPQDHASATYAHKITDAEAELDFTKDKDSLLNHIRAFSPWPSAWLMARTPDKPDPHRLNCLAAIAAEGTGKAGQFLGKGQQGGPVIATGDGAIEVILLKPAGKPMMSGRDYLNGYAMPDQVVPSVGRP